LPAHAQTSTGTPAADCAPLPVENVTVTCDSSLPFEVVFWVDDVSGSCALVYDSEPAGSADLVRIAATLPLPCCPRLELFIDDVSMRAMILNCDVGSVGSTPGAPPSTVVAASGAVWTMDWNVQTGSTPAVASFVDMVLTPPA
jgi:hypothetical protein